MRSECQSIRPADHGILGEQFNQTHDPHVRDAEQPDFPERLRRGGGTRDHQNLLCAYLSGAVLIGLAANGWFGWWWLDPLIGLAVAAVAVREGREAWRGKDCC